MTLASAMPILALDICMSTPDMYEHAGAIDYGAKAAAYVDTFMSAVNWSVADAHFVRAA